MKKEPSDPMQHPVVEKAKLFAWEAHDSIGHRRKYIDAPYAIHLEAVAALVAEVTSDPEVIAAAWLHDVVEDTPATLEDIEREFGARVAALVDELTDVSVPEDGNREVRKTRDRLHTAGASPEAKTIKLADLIDNSRSVMEHDPGFARVYMREKRLLLEVLHEGHADLYARATRIVEAYYGDRNN